MIITICIPPTPPAVDAKPEQVSHCRSFSDLSYAAAWMKERGIEMPCGSDWRWP